MSFCELRAVGERPERATEEYPTGDKGDVASMV